LATIMCDSYRTSNSNYGIGITQDIWLH